MRIQLERLLADIETLAGFGATEDGGVDRPSFSPADIAAKNWLLGRAREAGLSGRLDGAGNLYLRLDGPSGPAVWTGSHIDSVPNGGRLDGALGVLSGLECLRVLAQGVAENTIELTRSVEVVAFADEEGCYGSLLGSRAVIGDLTAEGLRASTGRDGTPLVDALARVGTTPERAATAAVDPREVAAYVELHIEQGPVLEAEDTDIGVVTDVVELGRGVVRFLGRADHAGTTPMGLRRDASRGVGLFLAALPLVPTAVGSEGAVVTCGRVEFRPGVVNIVPTEARLSLDVRDVKGRVPELQQAVASLARRAAEAHDLDVELEWEPPVPGVRLDPDIQSLITEAATEQGLSTRSMVSGAGHDAQILASVVPSAMIFVPSRHGRSHSPAEATHPAHIEAGANVLLAVLHRLAGSKGIERLPANTS